MDIKKCALTEAIIITMLRGFGTWSAKEITVINLHLSMKGVMNYFYKVALYRV